MNPTEAWRVYVPGAEPGRDWHATVVDTPQLALAAIAEGAGRYVDRTVDVVVLPSGWWSKLQIAWRRGEVRELREMLGEQLLREEP
jgi:hypothetical protein